MKRRRRNSRSARLRCGRCRGGRPGGPGAAPLPSRTGGRRGEGGGGGGGGRERRPGGGGERVHRDGGVDQDGARLGAAELGVHLEEQRRRSTDERRGRGGAAV